MGRYEREQKKHSRKWIWIIGLLIFAGLLVLFVMPQILYRMNHEESLQETEAQYQAAETLLSAEDSPAGHEMENITVFPAMLDEGNIEVESLFQFSGVNPDAGNQDVTDVASIVVTNTSDKYLREATVTATLASGAEMSFVVCDMPAGTSAMAFSIHNDNLLETDVCVSLTATADFETLPVQNYADISVDGTTVTVTNTSSEELNEIDVYYRDVFGEKYFGGKTYIYTIEQLSAGESTAFTAEESLLGVIEVVRVAATNKN